jgi:hypothetical protein
MPSTGDTQNQRAGREQARTDGLQRLACAGNGNGEVLQTCPSPLHYYFSDLVRLMVLLVLRAKVAAFAVAKGWPL